MAFLNQTKNRLIAIATLSGFACAAMIAVLRFAPPSRLGQKDAETAQSLAIWVDLLGAFVDEKLVLPATLNDLARIIHWPETKTPLSASNLV